jgi:hypothetical protein
MEIPGHVGEFVEDVGDAALCPTRTETPSADGAGGRFFFVPHGIFSTAAAKGAPGKSGAVR